MLDNESIKTIKKTLPLWHFYFTKPFSQFLRDGITREECLVLALLYYHHDLLSMKDLTRLTNTSKQQMTRVIKNLIKLGFVEKVFDENDKRIIRIKISEKGKEYQQKQIESENTYYEKLLALMDENERSEFISALKSINNILEKIRFEELEEK